MISACPKAILRSLGSIPSFLYVSYDFLPYVRTSYHMSYIETNVFEVNIWVNIDKAMGGMATGSVFQGKYRYLADADSFAEDNDCIIFIYLYLYYIIN